MSTTEALEPSWLPISTAPKDGTLVRLLVNFECHATADKVGPCPTIGSNTSENTGEADVWQFAGWNWEHDCYTEGIGTPIAWMPMLSDQRTQQSSEFGTSSDELIRSCEDNIFTARPELIEQVIVHVRSLQQANENLMAEVCKLRSEVQHAGSRFQGQDFDNVGN